MLKRASPLLTLMIAGIVISGAVAVTVFWTSPSFTKDISVGAVFDAFCSVFNPEALVATGDTSVWGWDYSGLTELSLFTLPVDYDAGPPPYDTLPGYAVRIVPNVRNRNVAGDDVWMKINVVGGDYPGTVSAQIRMYKITYNAERTLDYIAPEGVAVNVANVETMSPVKLTSLLKDWPQYHYFVEVAFTFNGGGAPPGDYSVDVNIQLTNGS